MQEKENFYHDFNIKNKKISIFISKNIRFFPSTDLDRHMCHSNTTKFSIVHFYLHVLEKTFF